MDHYSFNRPRRDGWLSWPCWLTDSGRLTHKVVTRPATSLAQDRESSPARTGVLTTMLRNQLQSAMNAAARLVVKKRKSDSITPLRDTLHWLLVRERIDFKLCLLVYKCLHQLAAPYLESMIFPVSAVSTRRHLRSASQGDLTVPRTRTVGFGPRSFSVAGPSLWNTMPSDMKQSSLSIAQFCSQLKSVMFVRSFYA